MSAAHLISNLLFIFVSLANVIASTLPHEKCALVDSDCLKRQAQASLPTFLQGMPELGINKFDLLQLNDNITIKTPDIFYELRNIKIKGFNDTIIDDIRIQLPLKLMRLSFHTTLMIDAYYKIDGILFGFPAYGEGKIEVALRNLQIEMIIMFEIVKNEQGKDIMNLKTHFYGADSVDGMYTHLDNMYNGDKEKSDLLHEVINTNWRTITANFGRFFTTKLIKDIFEAIQKYMGSRPLEEFAVY